MGNGSDGGRDSDDLLLEISPRIAGDETEDQGLQVLEEVSPESEEDQLARRAFPEIVPVLKAFRQGSWQRHQWTLK